jgi:hypothetical protein
VPTYNPFRRVSLRSPVTNTYHARHANRKAAIVWTASIGGGQFLPMENFLLKSTANTLLVNMLNMNQNDASQSDGWK